MDKVEQGTFDFFTEFRIFKHNYLDKEDHSIDEFIDALKTFNTKIKKFEKLIRESTNVERDNTDTVN